MWVTAPRSPSMAPRRGWLLALLLPCAAACTSAPLQLYEGPARDAAMLAVVTMPEQLELLRLNGAEVPASRGLWQHGEQRLQLLPGHYELLVFYREFWDVGSQEQVLRSDPARFVIDAAAGGHYRIDYARTRNVREAERLQADFHGWVDDAQGRRQASTPSDLVFRRDWTAALGGGGQLLARSPQAASVPAAIPAGAASAMTAAPASTLTDMQDWWKRASTQQRSAFLQWLATQTP